MKKRLAMILCMLMLACLCVASVAVAETLNLSDIHAMVDISASDYILLTRNNLSRHPEWIETHATTAEDLLDDWEARGVYVQAWSRDDDVCLEISAVVDEPAAQYFNINAQNADVRKAYRTNHSNGTYYGDAGYTYDNISWKSAKGIGRWLLMSYKRSSDEETCRGYQYRTIRNGYTITLDYKVLGRAVRKADLTAIKNVMSTFKFTQVLSKPNDYVCKVVYNEEPPAETTTGKISISGTCDADLHLTAVAMRMSSSDKIVAEATPTKTGKFNMDIQLPTEGVWLVTVTVDKDGVITEEKVFDITTYQSSLLKINWENGIPTELNSNTYVLSGTTLKGTTVQCIVTDTKGNTVYDKSLVTNGKGAFSFKIPTSKDGTYNFVISLQKKKYENRRFTGSAERVVSEDERRDAARDNAVKPAYATLVEKIKGYTGKVLTYKMYVTSVSRSGDEWVMLMAMTSGKSGYKNYVAVTSHTEPNVTVGSQYRIYGTCTGTYLMQEEGKADKYYPCIDLMWIE